MGHNHSHSVDRHSKNKKRILITLFFTALYMFAEGIGGYFSNSLALLADAGHMLSDVASLALSLFAIFIAAKRPGPRSTFGYYRAEILAALINGVTLVVLAIIIFKEALERLQNPEQVQGGLLVTIALGGLIINIIGLFVLHKGKSENLNIKGAWLHVLMDAFGSVAAVLSGILILAFDWYFFDPIASMVISILVIYSAWSLLKETVAVLMESVPRHIDPDKVHFSVLGLNSVAQIHDLHIWTITSGMDSLSCHVVTDKTLSNDEVLYNICDLLKKRFDIEHVTIQIEPENFGMHTNWHCQTE